MEATAQEVASRARAFALAGELDPLDAAVRGISAEGMLGLNDEAALRVQSSNQLTGFGVLQPFMDDPEIEEIWINQPNEIFIAKSGVSNRVFLALSESTIKALVERMLRHSGRRLDRANPFVDAALEDGSRLHVAIPDITRKHWSVNIRKFPSKLWRLKQLVERGVLNEKSARFIAGQIRAGKNVLISGATQAGKTTLLCALISETNPEARLITVEETFEIRAENSDWVALQTRQQNLEGKGEVTLRRLVKESLRMRPDVLVVGEVREAESLDLLIAMNSGLPGICTIHANSAAEAIEKLCTLPLLAGANIVAEFVERTVANCIDLVIHCAKDQSGSRTVAEIAIVKSSGGKPQLETIGFVAHD
jgi:pilus assembly protein CpaF